jgi:multidrug efflux pump subunit AcrB
MNPIHFALRRPVTILTLLVGLAVAGGIALWKMRVDVFPTLNLPVVYVCQPYGGLDAAQMEGMVTNYYEYHFLYVSGIKAVESRNIQGVALLKLMFHPGTDMAQAMSEVVAAVNRSRAFAPTGTIPPFVMRFDTGSVPVGYLVFEGAGRNIGEIQDLAMQRVRPLFASLPGVSTPPAFGGTPRTLIVNVDPDRLRSYHLTPDDVIAAVAAGNAVIPSGNARIADRMPIVPTNAMVPAAVDLGSIPVRPGESLFLRDVAQIEDGNDVQTGFALVNGRRGVYLLVNKKAEASSLAVVREVKAALPRMQAVLPEDLKVRFDFDQTPVVTRAMQNVAFEGLLGALLTGLMVLVFLRDWRSVVVVVLNIPLALIAAVVALWLTGQTINLMTLAGLALAVGVLVDESTVEVENIHAQLRLPGSVVQAVLRGNSETAVPRLLALLCVLAVFVPVSLMEGTIRSMLAPLALAVSFAMMASYLLSSTFVPVAAAWLLRRHPSHDAAPAGDRVSWPVRLRLAVVPAYFVVAAIVLWLVFPRLGQEIFPTVDTGQFQFRVKAPTGTRLEIAEELTLETLRQVQDLAGPGGVESSLGYVGGIPSQYPVQCIYHWSSGPDEGLIRVGLNPAAGIRVEPFKVHLRRELPGRLRAWLAERLTREGLSPADVASRLPGLRLSLEPADIINEVMTFGSAAAVEVVVHGPKQVENRGYADRLMPAMQKIPGLQDLQFGQALDYPTVEVTIDRERAGQSGATAQDVARALVAATSSSRFVAPNYWRDPASGVGYFVQVQVPPARIDSAAAVGMIPVRTNTHGGLLVRDVAGVREGVMPGQIDRLNMRRFVSLSGNVGGSDLGSVARGVDAAIRSAGDPPRGALVEVRGQIEPMRQMFTDLARGLVLAVVAVFLVLTAYFQAPRLALVALAAVPAGLAGAALALWLTGTTLNIQSYLGAILAVGVAVANAILLVTFAERERQAGATAAVAASRAVAMRRRAVLMTACAMLIGMVPMAVSGQQTASLARAVLGGLGLATVATLTVLPAVYALIAGNRRGGAGFDEV